VTVTPAPPSLSAVSAAEWEGLAARRIFFGHQSVGGNITQGLTEVLESHPEIRLSVVESKAVGPRAGFYHARNGENGYPDRKADEFVQIASRDLTAPGSIGMMKLCYVDVTADSDPRELFAEYQRRMVALRAQNPGLTVVHFTMPLFVDDGTLYYWKLKVRGYPAERDRNVVRNRYNELLREAYSGKEPIFDIATIESTHPDGSRSFFRHFGKKVYAVAPEYTYDGGHFNEASRRLVAERLLVFLAKLPSRVTSEVTDNS